MTLLEQDAKLNTVEACLLLKSKMPAHVWHVTPKDRLPTILKDGLTLKSNRNTHEGVSLGIYLCSYYDIIADIMKDSLSKDLVAIKIGTSSLLNARLDPEFYSANDSIEDIESELDTMLVFYVTNNIPASSIIEYVDVELTNYN